MKMNQKGLSTLEVILLLIIIGLVGFVGWYVYDTNQKNKDDEVVTTQTSSNKTTTSKPSIEKSTASDEELIIKAVKNYGDNTENMIVKVDTITGNNAKGTSSYTDGPGGSAFIAHKSNGKWTVIYQGQQLPGKDLGDQYNLPSGWYSTDY